jgi:hypothetical protein
LSALDPNIGMPTLDGLNRDAAFRIGEQVPTRAPPARRGAGRG